MNEDSFDVAKHLAYIQQITSNADHCIRTLTLMEKMESYDHIPVTDMNAALHTIKFTLQNVNETLKTYVGDSLTLGDALDKIIDDLEPKN